jgi:hypothetical protein
MDPAFGEADLEGRAERPNKLRDTQNVETNAV